MCVCTKWLFLLFTAGGKLAALKKPPSKIRIRWYSTFPSFAWSIYPSSYHIFPLWYLLFCFVWIWLHLRVEPLTLYDLTQLEWGGEQGWSGVTTTQHSEGTSRLTTGTKHISSAPGRALEKALAGKTADQLWERLDQSIFSLFIPPVRMTTSSGPYCMW